MSAATANYGSVDILASRLRLHELWEQTTLNTKCPSFVSRAELYAHVTRSFLCDGKLPVDFFEFGVYRGESLSAWGKLITDPRARFFGFDSFMGLPEYWKPSRPKGTFSTFGRPPHTNDERVRFISGWFQESLPQFLRSYHPSYPLVIHIDSDLYSSALFCLATMNAVMLPGTLIIFDEFDDILHEFRALMDYANAFMRSYEIVAATLTLTQVTVRLN